MATAAVTTLPEDRRQRRRRETIDEVISTAIEVMAVDGVAGLSLGEVARRMGMRAPSLYGYFPSKHALYDAVFARGAAAFGAELRAAGPLRPDRYAGAELARVGEVAVRWSLEHPTYSHLLFWRPVPGFTPSAEAYAPAVELMGDFTQQLVELQAADRLRQDVGADQLARDWTILLSGVISQQLSNGPGIGFDDGEFAQRLAELAEMFAHFYAPASGRLRPRTRRGRHAPDR